jgi:23S rRNA pseudouridine955/2504/2580 synthase/23S rRNA pseudouridine1911/1915/1917 synthase
VNTRLGPRVACCRIPADAAGHRLLDFLATRFTYHDRTEWAALLATGRVERNGQPGTGEQILVPGDVIEYQCGDIPEPPVPTDFDILHEDAGLLVLAKPPGLPVHPAGRYFAHTLWGLLRERGYDDLHFLSRLDRETSGLLLAAKTPDARAHLQRQPIAKTYLVAVEGEFPDALEAIGWLSRDPASAIRKKRRFYRQRLGVAGEQSAETHLRRLACDHGLSLLQADLVTGRTHQIRATLCSLGFPVVGDKIYGRDETWFLRFRDDQLTPADRLALRLPHQALHSWRLALQTGNQLSHEWSCPPPLDFAGLSPGFPAR